MTTKKKEEEDNKLYRSEWTLTVVNSTCSARVFVRSIQTEHSSPSNLKLVYRIMAFELLCKGNTLGIHHMFYSSSQRTHSVGMNATSSHMLLFSFGPTKFRSCTVYVHVCAQCSVSTDPHVYKLHRITKPKKPKSNINSVQRLKTFRHTVKENRVREETKEHVTDISER